MRVFKRLNILLIGLIAALPAIAQEDTPPEAAPTSKQFGDVTVHFTVLNTSFLNPQVARSYGIVRGDNKFLMNVAVSKQEEQRSRALRAEVSGSSSDLIHRTPLEFREVIEQDAIYYIAELEIDSKRERRDFRLSVKTDERPQPYDIQFNKQLYRDGD